MDFQLERRFWVESNPMRRWRLHKDLNQVEIATLLGVSGQTIRLWESGTIKPRKTTLAKLAEIMGIDVAELTAAWDTWLSENRPTVVNES
jgi:transcriptional regulator with XRE-family HTH domain